MRVLVAHLSDIHIRSGADPIFALAEKIGNAVRSRNDGASLILCIVSGDISDSGKVEQFDAASKLFASLAKAVGSPMRFVLVPGNHDVDFERASAAREALVKTVLQAPADKIDPSIVEILAEPQQAFFELRDKMIGQDDHVQGDHATYVYRFDSDGERVVVRCVNTALLSSLAEKAGSLVLPSQPSNNPDNEHFTITVFHHPFNWMSPGSKKIGRALEQSSDLILTGHEHEHDRGIKYRPEAYCATTYIEAAALQQHSRVEESAFNVLSVDTKDGIYKFFHFELKGDLYASKSIVGEWEGLPLRSRRAEGFREVAQEFSLWLTDSGIPGDVNRGKRQLSDIYVYPNLVESVHETSLNRKRLTIQGEDVFHALERKAITFISGMPKSGRTSLARKVFLDFSAAGYVPLYIDAVESGLHASNAVLQVIERQAKIQYGADNVEAYFQLTKERRLVILDNAERMKGRIDDRVRLVEGLAEFASHVVILGDDSTGGITELDADSFSGTDNSRASYQVEEFNHGNREELAQRWFAGDDADEAEASRRLERAVRTVDTVIGRNYVPAYPIYIIALLQAVEEGGAIDPKASTHGYFYDLLIRQALATRSGTKNVGIRFAFLTHLACEMYSLGLRQLLESQLRDSFQRYDEKHAVGGLEYEKLIGELVDRGMLWRSGDTVSFRYPYLYNYFVASYLSRNINDDEVRKEVKRLTENLGDDQSNDILLFLAHLSHDLFVSDSLLSTAKGLVTSYEPETLETARKDDGVELRLKYVEHGSQAEARKEAAKRQDAQLSREGAGKADPGNSEASETGSEVLAVLNTIRVMGQIVKNFPGVLTKETKTAIVDACCDLGLRLLRFGLEKFDSGTEEVVAKMIELIHHLSPDMPEHKKKVRAERYLWFLSIATSYGILRALVLSLASQELEPIYDVVFSSKASASRKLINLGLRLDVSPSFPEGLVISVVGELKSLRLAESLAKLFVLSHFDRIYLAPAKRQSVCSRLGIRYQVLSAKKIVGLRKV